MSAAAQTTEPATPSTASQSIQPMPAVRSMAYLESRDTSENSILFDRPKYEQAYKIAELFASSDLVPAHFRLKPSNCFIAVQLAHRLELDPFMVLQSLYVVHGKPGFEAKFIIALINKSGLFADPLDFEFEGVRSTDEWTVTVSAKRAKTGKTCALPFRYATAKAEGWVGKEGSKWKTMPDQMMMYRAAAFFSRVYCPEVTMGMQTREELDDVGESPSLATLPTGRTSFREVVDQSSGEVHTNGQASVVENISKEEFDARAKLAADARLRELREKAAANSNAADPLSNTTPIEPGSTEDLNKRLADTAPVSGDLLGSGSEPSTVKRGGRR